MRFSRRAAYTASLEVAFLAMYTGQQFFGLKSCLFAGVILTGTLTILLLAIFIVLVVKVLSTPRTLMSLADEKQTVLGRPLFYPIILSHNRLSPIRNQFTYRVLFIGIPVGLRCRVGHLLNIDQECQNDQERRPLFELGSWFSFDSERYLHRGDGQLSLQAKLHRFLKDQNEDPNQWPFAYMISVPKFLWWSRSVVTWWYLYSPERVLDAVIMEINNSFDEKRNILFKVRPADPDENIIKVDTSTSSREGYPDTNANVNCLSSMSRSKFYKGDWEKHIFASPFEKVEGSISARFMDPLNEQFWESNASLSNTTSLSPSGEPKMVARAGICGPPLDPVHGTTVDLVKFLWNWTLPGTLTTPRILFQAMRLHYYLGWMKMFDKPVIQSGSEPREATESERVLERFFRTYLVSLVASYPGSLSLSYIPAKSISRDAVHLQSPSYKPSIPGTSLSCLNIEVVDPEFYTRVTTYSDQTEAFAMEVRCTGDAADSTSQRLVISDFALLAEIIATTGKDTKEQIGLHASGRANWYLLYAAQWLRGNLSSPSFMDTFVFQIPNDQSSRFVYASTVMRHWLVARYSFGSYRLLQVYLLLCAIFVRWFVLENCATGGDLSFWTYQSIPINILGAVLYCTALITVPL